MSVRPQPPRRPSIRLPAMATAEQVRVRLERLAALGARAAQMAHELRNALSVIDTTLQLVRRMAQRLPGGEVLEVHLGRMSDQVHSGLRIVHEVLDEARDAPPERELVDVRVLVGEPLAGVDHPEDVELILDLPASRVSVDPKQFRQVVLNLVRNAIEAVSARTTDGPRVVHVAATVEDGTFELRVEDNGPGIDPVIAPRLFEAFASGRSGGVGLGLAVSKRIASAHGGIIEVVPVHPHGSSFRVRVPLA